MSTPDSANPTNDHVDMAGYVMDMLTPEEKQRADEHLTTCTACREEIESLREWSAALDDVPEAMLLDGPPDDADLLLQRTLRQVRQESAGRRHRRLALVTSIAAAVVAVAVVGGALVGRTTAPSSTPQAAPPAASVPAAERSASGVSATTGARMTVSVVPATGWVRVSATVGGIPAGERCKLEVVGKDGAAVLAGSWLVSPAGEANGTPLNGSALIDPAQVASVRVVNTGGKEFINVPV
ncbi:anti-sigma factor [Actinoplanes sp. TBRC 11911]|uniref:anti-sigma factor n=1 Tax=Actinoplanes sp. TBRC 11911 TaxID=2729386 RepID=UPI00145E7A2E|nr:zf-HC2 domain-containing protein [Actinoplanes sp. TBRC 11911]NMO51620.1 anti-sigma factor [Actinoplanes sp. TBRC 11911]